MIGTHGATNEQLDGLQNLVASRYGLSNLKTADPGQSMMNKLGLTGSTSQKPKTVQEALALAAEGKIPANKFGQPATMSMDMGPGVKADSGGVYMPDNVVPIPHHHEAALRAGAQAAKHIDPDAARAAKFASTQIINLPRNAEAAAKIRENEAAEFAKVMGT